MQFLPDQDPISSIIHNLSNHQFPINSNQYTKPNFTSLHTVVTENKPYTPITTCVLEHILTTTHLCDLEKLFYILVNSLSLINHNKGKQRSITLSAKQWAEKLDCSVAEIFAMQQSLEQKGYFEIYRSKTKDGKNKKNTITPTLPDSVFNSLANTPNRFNIGTYSTDTSLYSNFTSIAYLPNLETKIAYLDRTKMFIKLNYDLLLLVTSSNYLTKYAKVLWLDFYSIGYRYYLKHRDCDNNTTKTNQYHAKNTEELHEMLMYTSDNIKTDDYVNYVAPPNSYFLTTTYKELQDKYSCSKPIISKTLKELETLGFITRKRFFVKNDDEDSNLHDKSVWRITVTLPDMIQQHLQNEVKDRAKSSSGSVVSNSDPYVVNSSQYKGKQRSITLSAKQWAEKLDCSVAEIFAMQQSLEQKGYFEIYRSKTKDGKNKKNTITPTLPDSVFNSLANTPNRFNIGTYSTDTSLYSNFTSTAYLPNLENPSSESVVFNSDPYVINSCQYINKYFISNTKDLDNIDSKKSFFENTNDSSPKNLSELSEFYKNSLEEEILLEKEQKIVSSTTTLPIINTHESILNTETSNNLEEGKLKAIEEISETLKGEQEKTLLLKQLNEQSNEEEQINTANGLVNTRAEIPVASTINLLSNSSIHNKSLSYNKPSTQAKSLKSFYPLTKEQVDKLNQLSSREFSNNFANQLLLKLYIRDPNKTFASKNHMISYMSKVFRYEKHQAPMVNHETFRFTANVSDPESVEMQQKEKYLTEVEYSMDTSYSCQLRKKIAGMFETKLAYQILTEGKFDYHATKYQTTSQKLEITNDAWQNLELSEENNITQFEHIADDTTCFVDSSLSLASRHDIADINYDTQLSINFTENDQMKSSLVITENDDIIYDINDKIVTRELSELSLESLPAKRFTNITLANTCTVKLPKDLILTNRQQQNLEKAISTVYGYVKIVYQQLPATYKKLGQSRLPDEIFLAELDQNSVWYKIRKKLIDNFDEHIDKSWFSKLRAEEDAITQKLTLIAPTNFLRDWINANYGHVIKDIAKKLDYQFVKLVTKKQSFAMLHENSICLQDDSNY